MKPSSASWVVLTSSLRMPESGGSYPPTSGDISIRGRSKFLSSDWTRAARHLTAVYALRSDRLCVVLGFQYL